jgi:5-methylthioadenosine/S-adenosylhomocysteine deaminase
VDSVTLMTMMAEAGSQATGQEGRLGSLEPGRRADLTLLRTDRVFAPRSRSDNWHPLDVILDKADARDIEAVMVDGQVIVRDGRVTTVDAGAVLDRHREEIDRREHELRTNPAIRVGDHRGPEWGRPPVPWATPSSSVHDDEPAHATRS